MVHVLASPSVHCLHNIYACVYVRVRVHVFFISVQISIHVLFAWYILLLKCYVYMLNQVALALLVLSRVPYGL